MNFAHEALQEVMEQIGQEIEDQKKKTDGFDVTGKIKEGKIQGLEIAKEIVKELYNQVC